MLWLLGNLKVNLKVTVTEKFEHGALAHYVATADAKFKQQNNVGTWTSLPSYTMQP